MKGFLVQMFTNYNIKSYKREGCGMDITVYFYGFFCNCSMYVIIIY